MKTTSNYTEDAKKLAELMSTLTEEDKKIVMIHLKLTFFFDFFFCF